MSDFVLCFLRMQLVSAKRVTKNIYYVTTFSYSSGQDYPFLFLITCKSIDGKLSRTLQKFVIDCTTNFVQGFPNFVCEREAYVFTEPLFTDDACSTA